MSRSHWIVVAIVTFIAWKAGLFVAAGQVEAGNLEPGGMAMRLAMYWPPFVLLALFILTWKGRSGEV